ncbi:Uncharacterised protein [Mycobacteroides abscessus subsp. abscessus]|nr:Uncharacterised protein [Mycobacteroides abscessus subsp. abscessus]
MPKSRPPSPVTGKGVPALHTSKPVAKTMQSNWCSIPSTVRMPFGASRAMGQVTSLQLSACSAG